MRVKVSESASAGKGYFRDATHPIIGDIITEENQRLLRVEVTCKEHMEHKKGKGPFSYAKLHQMNQYFTNDKNIVFLISPAAR